MATSPAGDLCERLYRARAAWWACLLALFVTALLVRLAAFTGLIGSDDLWYSRYAQDIAAGIVPRDTNQFAGRSGVTLALGALYRLFGISEGTTVALPLLASSASVPLLAAIGARLYGPLAGLLAALLLCTSPIDVRFATILVPEPLMGFWILAGVWCFVVATARASVALAAAAGALIGIAYLTKEPAAFVAVALAAAAFVSRQPALAAAVAAGALAVVGAEMAAYQYLFGDPLHRIAAARVGVPRFVDVVPQHTGDYTPGLAERLFRTYPRLMVYPTAEFALHYVAGLVTAAAGLALVARHRVLVLSWAALPWLFLNFGSASLDRYMPIWPAARYISLTLPPLFVLGAAALTAPALWRRPAWRHAAAVLLLAVAVTGSVAAYAGRASDWRTREIAALRSIVAAANDQDMPICRQWADSGDVISYGDSRIEVWSSVVAILDPARGRPREPRLILERDRLGMPYAREGRCGLVPEVSPPRLVDPVSFEGSR